MEQTKPGRSGSPFLLAVCLVAAGFVALSIHVGALLLGDPYPVSNPPQWARWLNGSSMFMALLTVLNLARSKLKRYGTSVQIAMLFGIVSAIGETLRGTIMNGFASKAWAFAFLGLPEQLVRNALITLLCVLAAGCARSRISVIIAGLLLGALYSATAPMIFAPFADLKTHFSYMDRPEVYSFPYPLSFQIPAYLMFLEPVIGAAALASLIWDKLPGAVLIRALTLGLLVALVKGVVIMTLLFSFFMEVTPAAGMLSFAQFLFEFLTLGFFTGLAWYRFGPSTRITR